MLWSLGAVILLAAIATITSRAPVYSAVWFALTLFGVGGWMLVQGAQFLAVATVAVYAGAIVVMLLFVLMLAQPEGQAFYDRVSWGRLPALLSAATGALFVGLVVLGLVRGDWTPGVDSQWTAAVQEELQVEEVEGVAPRALRALRVERAAGGQQLRVVVQAIGGRPLTESKQQQWQQAIAARLAQLAPSQFGPDGSWRVIVTDADVLAGSHVSVLGRQLFGQHLIAVEVAGILLYLALVGAVAMAAVPVHWSPATPGART
jgi:NADH-quinone oxidoreductase subunit J